MTRTPPLAIPDLILDKLDTLPDDWEKYPESRRAATEDDPLLFAWLYLRDHLHSEETGDLVTFSAVHVQWAEYAEKWMEPLGGPMESRDAFVGPRSLGKSTWWYLILPMWAAAHGHVKFAAAFADSATQAETHLQTFKHELDTNTLLRKDFPSLCKPGRRQRSMGSPEGGTLIADNRAMLYTSSGFIFAARGIDSGNLGMKVGSQRPDLLILDDVEPGESNYSALQMDKRLGTIKDVIFPLNVNARVVIVGTVVMPSSIIHQLVRSVRGSEPEPWIVEERITVHFSPAIWTDHNGFEHSIWPGRWSLDFLNSIRHTRSYAKNYANDPMGHDGAYWSESDFTTGDVLGITRRILSVDPAVTTKTSSDPSGVAMLGLAPERYDDSMHVRIPKTVLVEHAESVRLTGNDLRVHLLRIIEKWQDNGKPVSFIYVETNQGGDLWLDVFRDLPIPVKTVHQTIKKELRAAEALAEYQRGRVIHAPGLRAAEEEMVAFPNAPHDDMVDAIGAGVLRLLKPPTKKRRNLGSVSYV